MTVPKPPVGTPQSEQEQLEATHRHVLGFVTRRDADGEPHFRLTADEAAACARWFLAARELATARVDLDEANNALVAARPEDAASFGLEPFMYLARLQGAYADAQRTWDHWWAEERDAAEEASRAGLDVRSMPKPSARPRDQRNRPQGPRAAFAKVTP